MTNNFKKEKFIPHLNNLPETEENFEEIFQEMEKEGSIQEGTVVKGQVIEVTKDTVTVDVGLKNECRIPITEFVNSLHTEPPKAGDVVDVFVEKIESRKGTLLSRQKAMKEQIWKDIEKLYNEKKNIEGTIFGRVKGGFTVDLSGIVAFLPGSQVDVRPIEDTNSIMNVAQPFQILKMDNTTGNIVVSRRAIVEESRSEAKAEMLQQIKKDIEAGKKLSFTGTVKNIKNYGAFIDLGLIDGLLHVNDICWNRINHPSEVLTLGQEVKVQIIEFNTENNRIYLGMKQLEASPWDNINSKVQVGKEITGKVTNIVDYGVFINISDGIEGLVHSSEIAWGRNKQNTLKKLAIGQEIKCKVLEINEKDHRISLSMKQCVENPLSKFASQHKVGDVITVPIRNITDFGLFVEIDKNVDGMIHISDISWDGVHNGLIKKYQVAEEIECKILNIDPDNEKISLGIKQLTEDPFEKYINDFALNDTVNCKITNVKSEGIEILIEDKIKSFIKKNDISLDRSEQRTNKFNVNDEIQAKIINLNKEDRKINLSIRALEEDLMAKAKKDHGSADANNKIGDLIKDANKK